MNCPKCGSNNLKVIDTISDLDDEVYRCRRCIDCGNKIYTVEFEVESNDEVRDVFRQAHRDKNARSNRYRGPVVIFKKNNF